MKKNLLLIVALLACLIFNGCDNSIEKEYPIALMEDMAKTELALGETAKLKVKAKYSDGKVEDITSECTFELRGSTAKEYLQLNGSTVKVINAPEHRKANVSILFYYKRNVGSIFLMVLPTDPL